MEEVPLCGSGVEHSQQLGQPSQSIGGQSALLVPKFKHLQSYALGIISQSLEQLVSHCCKQFLLIGAIMVHPFSIIRAEVMVVHPYKDVIHGNSTIQEAMGTKRRDKRQQFSHLFIAKVSQHLLHYGQAG